MFGTNKECTVGGADRETKKSTTAAAAVDDNNTYCMSSEEVMMDDPPAVRRFVPGNEFKNLIAMTVFRYVYCLIESEALYL